MKIVIAIIAALILSGCNGLAPTPTNQTCGDQNGQCLSSPACKGLKVGAACTVGNNTGTCTAISNHTAAPCCSCKYRGQPQPGDVSVGDGYYIQHNGCYSEEVPVEPEE